MQTNKTTASPERDGNATDMALFKAGGSIPEGALITGDTAEEGKIAVIYNRGDTPPEITITGNAGAVQTILANGMAVAVVARADGPQLTSEDVMLVERFVA